MSDVRELKKIKYFLKHLRKEFVACLPITVFAGNKVKHNKSIMFYYKMFFKNLITSLLELRLANYIQVLFWASLIFIFKIDDLRILFMSVILSW